MSAKSTSSANNLNRTDAGNPTITGDWTVYGWIKISGYGTTFTQGWAWNGTGGGVGCDTDEVATDSLDIFISDGISGFDATSIATSGYTDWVFFAVTHASGSSNYIVYWRKEGETSLSTDTITFGAQIVLLPVVNQWLFWDGGGPNPNTSLTPWVEETSVLSSATLLTRSQSLTDPGGTHTFLGLTINTDTTNTGSGGAFTLNGTLTTDTDNPDPTIGGGAQAVDPGFALYFGVDF